MTNIKLASVPNQTEIRGRNEGAQLSKRRSPTSLADRPRTPSIPLRKSEVTSPNTGADVLKSPRTDRQQVSHSVINQREAPRTLAR